MSEPGKTVSSVSEFTEWVREVGHYFERGDQAETPWFRGTGDAGHRLVPGLYRTQAGRDEYSDDELRTEFARKALSLVAERAPRNEWEWYFLMQHYRAPTRLLDWTDSALVALYFALAAWVALPKGSENMPRPSVWALNPFALSHGLGAASPATMDDRYLPSPYRSRKEREENPIPRHPMAIDPAFTAQRMLVQRSHFTLHGSDTRGIDEMKEELNLGRGLLQVVIDLSDPEETPMGKAEYLRWHLGLLGTTETSIFPDLEGLARELRWEYGLDKRDGA